MEKIIYADRYSKAVWDKLMKNFDEIPNFRIGCNDVSDLVFNAIIDALSGMKEFTNTDYRNNVCTLTDPAECMYEPIIATGPGPTVYYDNH